MNRASRLETSTTKTELNTDGKAFVTLRFAGDDLDPDEISAVLPIKPTRAHRKGEEFFAGPRAGNLYGRTGMWFLATDKLVPSDDLQDHLAFVQKLLSPRPGDTSRIAKLRDILARTHSAAHVTCFWRGEPGEPTPRIPDRFKSAIQSVAADIEADFAMDGQNRQMDIDAAVKRMSEAFAAIQQQGVSGPLITNAMVKLRELLEASGNKRVYQSVNLFANWSVHTTIDRDAAAREILNDVNSVVENLWSGTFSGIVAPEITKQFRFDRFRYELLAICAQFSMDDRPVRDHAAWEAFRSELISEVCAKPITMTARAISSLASEHPGMLRIVSGLSFSQDRHWILVEGKYPPTVRLIQIIEISEIANLSANPTRIVSPVAF
jgi:Domain of unknown function (DUF4279)